MTRFPSDFAEVLTERGRRLLDGREPTLVGALSRTALVVADDLIQPGVAQAAPALLERAFGGGLVEMNRRAPTPQAAGAAEAEALPKVGRVMSSPYDGEGAATLPDDAAGLSAMLRSAAYHGFVERLCGYPVRGPMASQVLCYRPGDYAGPHTDYRPDFPETRNGYTDVHLTFCSDGVTRQLLVYEREGHLSQVAPITGAGMLTAYRLPFWHYTTPLEGAPSARRWLVLGTFIDT